MKAVLYIRVACANQLRDTHQPENWGVMQKMMAMRLLLSQKQR